MTRAKDHFSQHAKSYSLYRPHYPAELFAYLNNISTRHQLAWDCATGNGQAALPLAKYFQAVIATDVSDRQLDQAPFHPRVTYRRALAEDCGLEAGGVDLTTVAQAFHWLDFASFFAEVKRVSSPGAHLAVWTYNLSQHSMAVDKIVEEFYNNTVGRFWDPERRFVEQGYRTISVPFTEIKTPEFEMTSDWTMDHFLGYLNTWSATQKWIAEDPSENSVEILRESLKGAWGPHRIVRLRWPLSLRLFKI